MTTDDIILHIFYVIATSMPNIPRHSQAKLYPSELVTIGVLFALKGGYFRAFYRWLKRDYGNWFGDGTLPERTRLQRLLKPIRTGATGCWRIQRSLRSLTVIQLSCCFPSAKGAAHSKLAKKE